MSYLKLKLVQRGKRTFPDEIIEFATYPKIVGREDGDFVIKNDSYLSSTHFAAWFDKEQKSLVIRDLGSANGTKINGVKIKPHNNILVFEGDMLLCGECLFMVVA